MGCIPLGPMQSQISPCLIFLYEIPLRKTTLRQKPEQTNNKKTQNPLEIRFNQLWL